MSHRVQNHIILFSGIILILCCLLSYGNAVAGGNMTMGSANLGTFNLDARLIGDSSLASFNKLIKNIPSNETLERIAAEFDNFLVNDNPKVATLPNSFLTLHYLILPINNAFILFLEFKNNSSGYRLSNYNLSYNVQVGNDFKLLDKASTTTGSDIRFISLPIRTTNELDNLSSYKMLVNVFVLDGHTIKKYTANLNLMNAVAHDLL